MTFCKLVVWTIITLYVSVTFISYSNSARLEVCRVLGGKPILNSQNGDVKSCLIN